MKALGNVLVGIIGLATLVGVIYGCYYITKTISYSFFYESMVQEHIEEVIKSNCIKGNK